MKIAIQHLYISRDHNYVGHHGKPPGTNPIEPAERIQCVAGKGIVGDRYFDYKPDFKGQITFFDRAVYDQMIETLGSDEGSTGRMRRNVIISGVDLNTLIGQTFKIGTMIFEGVEECKPCYWMNEAVAEGALDFLINRGGLRARILTDGWLETGEAELDVLAKTDI
jgi:MOSC domain-containing protein YiiM